MLLFVCSIRGAIQKKLIFRSGAGISLLRSNKWLFELTWPPDPSDKHIKQNRGVDRSIQGLRCCENLEGKGGLVTEIYKVRLSTTTKLPALPLTLLWHVHAKFFDIQGQNRWVYMGRTFWKLLSMKKRYGQTDRHCAM